VRRLVIAVPLLFLALTATAFGGGWATVGMSSTPDGVQPGKPWVVEMTILQHGRTPLQGLNPALTISSGDARQTFHAKETREPGVYRVSVTFPSSGLWNYEVNDGFVSGRPHTFKATQIGAPGTPPAAANTSTTAAADDGGPSLLWLIPGLAALAAAAALLVRRPRRPHHPQAA
jgi:MYXO-CTERM domain-containing protein